MSLLNYRPAELIDTRKLASDAKNTGENLTFLNVVNSKNDNARSAAYIHNTNILEKFRLQDELAETWELRQEWEQ